MFEQNPICKLLNIKYPIFQGGMAWIGTAELASAVSNAGGLGIIGAGHMPPDLLRAEIQKAKKWTDKPFGVNIMLMSPFVKEVMEVVIDERVAVVTTGAGNPAEYLPALKEVGTKVIPVVASVALAKRLVRSGVDVSNVIGFIGVGGPYSFSDKTSLSVRILLNQLFEKDYDRTKGEPCSLMGKNNIPMLLIQSRHDGLIDFSCAERFYEKAMSLGNECELYEVVDRKNTHSWYTAGMFLETRGENKGLDKFFTWIENM